MKLLAPLPLCTLIILGTGAAWFVLGNREHPPTSSGTRPRAPLVDTSLRERYLAAAADDNRTRRSSRFAVVFRQLTAESAAQLAAEFWAREKPSPFQNDWYDFLRRWTELDPPGVLAFAQANAGSLTEDWLLAILPVWASQDQEAAMRWWLNSASAGDAKLAAALVSAWADQDWQGAARWVDLNIHGSEQAALATALATRAVAMDTAGVQGRIEPRLAAGGSPTVIETALFLSLTSQKLRREPTEALAWISRARATFPCSRLIAGDCERLLTVDAADPPASNEERAAWLNWLAVRPSGNAIEDARARALNALNTIESETLGSGLMLFTNWLGTDAGAASEWLAGQRALTSYDAFALALARSVAAEAPDEAVAWAMTIRYSGMRSEFWGQWQKLGLPATPEIAAAIERDGTSFRFSQDRLSTHKPTPPPQ